jgi:glucose-1-phosphate cytidylyltransferase
MKVVILAGGLGTRISEETHLKPKPMVEIGGKPLIWHIMKMYGAYGLTDFIVCCGYKGYLIKEYFVNYFLHTSDITVDIAHNAVTLHDRLAEPWTVTLVDTGENTMTGGRLRRVREHLSDAEPFCLTYGDGLCSVNLNDLVAFHRNHKKRATLTAALPQARYGALNLAANQVKGFQEKPASGEGYINGGFFVLEPCVIDLISGDDDIWEGYPLETLAEQGELMAYVHRGFWQPMDTLREKNILESLWSSGAPPWKVW